MCAPGRDPLCHHGECNILFQRSDFAQIKVIGIVDIAFSSIHRNDNNLSKPLYEANVHLMRSVLQIGNATDTKMKVPVYDVAQEPCVQVNTGSDKGWVYSFWCLLSLPSAFCAGVAVVPSSDRQENSVPRLCVPSRLV